VPHDEARVVEAGDVEADAVQAGAVQAGAVQAGLAALRYRDLSERELERKLADRGFSEDERQDAVVTLRRTGVLDERRFAEGRARALASRGAGNRLIRYELERAGVPRDVAEEAIGALEEETDRAEAIVARRGANPKTARYLLAKGFSAEIASEAVASERDEELG
jgi:regulatory protein